MQRVFGLQRPGGRDTPEETPARCWGAAGVPGAGGVYFEGTALAAINDEMGAWFLRATDTRKLICSACAHHTALWAGIVWDRHTLRSFNKLRPMVAKTDRARSWAVTERPMLLPGPFSLSQMRRTRCIKPMVQNSVIGRGRQRSWESPIYGPAQ